MSGEAISGGKRERTRAALVAAALEVAREKGFTAASLDEIAERAGMTKGAIYSNFRGKAELMMAAMMSRDFSLHTDVPLDAPLREQLEATADSLVRLIDRARGEARFMAEFQLYALTDPEIRDATAQLYARTFAWGAAWFGRLGDLRAGVSPEHLAVAIQSLAMGFTVQSFLSPEAVTEAAIRTAFDALADGVVAEGA